MSKYSQEPSQASDLFSKDNLFHLKPELPELSSTSTFEDSNSTILRLRIDSINIFQYKLFSFTYLPVKINIKPKVNVQCTM